MWGSGIHPVHRQAGPTYKRRLEPAPWNVASALVCWWLGRRFLNMGTRQSQRPPVCHQYCGSSTAAKNSRSRVSSQSILCVFLSHDHVQVWAHKLNMQHLQKENLFRSRSHQCHDATLQLWAWVSFSASERLCSLLPGKLCTFSGGPNPFIRILAGLLGPSTQLRLITCLCHTLVKTTHLAQDLFLSLSDWQNWDTHVHSLITLAWQYTVNHHVEPITSWLWIWIDRSDVHKPHWLKHTFPVTCADKFSVGCRQYALHHYGSANEPQSDFVLCVWPKRVTRLE